MIYGETSYCRKCGTKTMIPSPRKVTIQDIAQALKTSASWFEGDISSGICLRIPLQDGRILLLQEGDSDDHHQALVISEKDNNENHE